MRKFNQLLAISGASMATAVGVLGIGEYQDHSWRSDRQGCYAKLTDKQEIQACLNDYDEKTQKEVQDIYGMIVLGLGAVGLAMGRKAFQVHQAQVERDEAYRRAEGLS